jgi:H+/gluconate symporter-like permease
MEGKLKGRVFIFRVGSLMGSVLEDGMKPWGCKVIKKFGACWAMIEVSGFFSE